jgi:hypothetical protein
MRGLLSGLAEAKILALRPSQRLDLVASATPSPGPYLTGDVDAIWALCVEWLQAFLRPRGDDGLQHHDSKSSGAGGWKARRIRKHGVARNPGSADHASSICYLAGYWYPGDPRGGSHRSRFDASLSSAEGAPSLLTRLFGAAAPTGIRSAQSPGRTRRNHHSRSDSLCDIPFRVRRRPIVVAHHRWLRRLQPVVSMVDPAGYSIEVADRGDACRSWVATHCSDCRQCDRRARQGPRATACAPLKRNVLGNGHGRAPMRCGRSRRAASRVGRSGVSLARTASVMKALILAGRVMISPAGMLVTSALVILS